MKQIVMNYIVWLLSSKDKSYNEIEKELLWFFYNISKIYYEPKMFTISIFNWGYKWEFFKKKINKFYQNTFKECTFDINHELDSLCEDIANRIIYNENIVIFTKYI